MVEREDNCGLYHADLLNDGYKVNRKIDDMYLYRKESHVIIARMHENGELEVLIQLHSLEGRNGDKKTG